MEDSRITTLLQAYVSGYEEAMDELIPLVYNEMHKIDISAYRYASF